MSRSLDFPIDAVSGADVRHGCLGIGRPGRCTGRWIGSCRHGRRRDRQGGHRSRLRVDGLRRRTRLGGRAAEIRCYEEGSESRRGATLNRAAVAVDENRLFSKRNPSHERHGRLTRIDRRTDDGVERRSRERDDIVLVVLVVHPGNPGRIGRVGEGERCHGDDRAEQQDHEVNSSYHPRRRYLMMVHNSKRIR